MSLCLTLVITLILRASNIVISFSVVHPRVITTTRCTERNDLRISSLRIKELQLGCRLGRLSKQKSASPRSTPFLTKLLSCSEDNTFTTTDTNHGDRYRFSKDIIRSLDLIPLIDGIARHAGTRRGRQALLAWTGEDFSSKQQQLLSLYGKNKMTERVSARRLRAMNSGYGSSTGSGNSPKNVFTALLAQSVDEAQRAYALVEQASHVLRTNDNDEKHRISFPPIYGVDSSPWDTATIAETDYDDWIHLPMEEWTLEFIAHAEQVIKMILQVQKWANCDQLQNTAPMIAEIAEGIPHETLEPVLEDISGSIEIVRIRTFKDPNGQSSFTFRLNDDKFHSLRIQREREDGILKTLGTGEPTPAEEKRLRKIREEIAATEEQIKTGLFFSIRRITTQVDMSLNKIAHLDVLFAKAAFGMYIHGRFPKIRNEGTINVQGFRHPVLILRDRDKRSNADNMMEKDRTQRTGADLWNGYTNITAHDNIVPIDLKLSSDQAALVISGPNGGGKTLALKSFGVAGALCQMAIPIPASESSSSYRKDGLDDDIPQVDLFENLFVSVGDHQSASEGESTWISRLNRYASVIEQIVSNTKHNNGSKITPPAPGSSLVLLDEIDSGTDPNAGGATAQAVLEKLVEAPKCRVVATSHTPYLKAASFHNELFGCASVLLEAAVPNRNKNRLQGRRPTFELLYGTIGDSYALEAASSQCTPSLPEDLLSRASDLVSSATIDNNHKDYLTSLASSMELQSQKLQEARNSAERLVDDLTKSRRATLSLAASYDRQLSLLEQKLESSFSALRRDKEGLELIGDSLAELRLVKKQIRRREDLLREKGLKMVPDSYEFYDGEAVVVVGGEWDGLEVEVVSKLKSLDGKGGRGDVGTDEEVAIVIPTEMISSEPNTPSSSPRVVLLKRYQIAVWDYDSVWDDNYNMMDTPVASVPNSQRRLNDVLSSLKAVETETKKKDKSEKQQVSFTSARERKAMKKQAKKKKRRK